MPVYVTLIRWTDQGRKAVAALPDRAAEVSKRVEAAGAKVIGNYVTMGRYDQIAVTEAPDDETVAKLALMIAGRGNAVTETLRCFSMDEARKLISQPSQPAAKGPSPDQVEFCDAGTAAVRIATPAALYEMKRDTVRLIDKVDAEALEQFFDLEDDR